MYDYSRPRRALPNMVQPVRRPRRGLRILTVLVLVFLLFMVLRWFVGLFGFSNNVIRMPATVQTEDNGIVSVLLEGGESRRAEDGMKLFPGEKLSSGAGGHASLTFFDGSHARLEEKTDLIVTESEQGTTKSLLQLHIEQGSLWISAPDATALSGSIMRQISTPTLTFILPAYAEALLSSQGVVVYAAAGEGIAVQLPGRDLLYIGEGQQFLLPTTGEAGADLYAYRSPLDPQATSDFVRESRNLNGKDSSVASSLGIAADLVILEPVMHAVVTKSVLLVSGNIGTAVTQVLINGHSADIDVAARTFSKEVSLPDTADQFQIKVQALDKNGQSLAEDLRVISRTAGLLATPTITTPAKDGQTFRTQKAEIILRGSAPKGATGMMVNDYKLQLFDATKGEWSYLASLALGNLKAGKNIYDVYALYDDGLKKSDPVRLTILQEEGTPGVVSDETPVSSAASSQSSKPLSNNAPLKPGTLSITSPAPGTSARTNTGVLIEGSTDISTDSIWVNDYRLQLYKSGKTTWNYIASPDLQNLKKGENVYHVIARNSEGQILDTFEYTITYEP